MFRTAASRYPRYPRFSAPTITPHAPPTKDMLAKANAVREAPAIKPSAVTPPSIKTSTPQQSTNKSNKINKVKHHLTTTQTAIPLPTTFAHPDMTTAAFRSLFKLSPTGKPIADATPLKKGESAFPYRFYQITLRRGLYGIEKDTKKCVNALGLHGRHEVVWRPVNANNAGLILKIRELVTVELVNEIPDIQSRPRAVKGYTKVGTALLNTETHL
ncbi:UNVERIFIED_CONTAM: hypothetical protein HDU68_012481 [Siphonaria sp. JEL0065]|nr:hypothetical protein HDU68_012481 [Siphonaria sp. JEL0065]